MKVLLVDDEIFTIRMLQNLISWKDLGMELIGYAQSGEEAYEKILREAPDIVISDIRMYEMSGIDLLKKIHFYNPDIRVILMSAYADFSYAKEALKAGCSDYILKPVDEIELEHSLRKVTAEILGEKEQKRKFTKNEEQLFQMKLYQYMKTGTGKNRLLNFETGFHLENFRVFLIRLDSSTIDEFDNSFNIEMGNEKYIRSLLEKEAEENNGRSYLFDYEDECWTILWENNSEETPEEFASRVIQRLETEMGISVNISFSLPGQTLEELPTRYQEVLNLGKYSFCIGDEKILGYGYNCDKQELEQILEAASSVPKKKQTMKKEYSKPVQESISLIEEHYRENLSLEEICSRISVSKNYFCYLFKRETGVSLWNYLTEIRLRHAKDLLKNTTMKSYEIAFSVGYENPSYFSKIFKKYEQMTPNEYRDTLI